MEVIRHASADEAKKGLVARVSSELATFQENGIPVLFLFSGGSALSVLDMIDFSCLGGNLTFAPVDERFDPSGEASNLAAFMETDFFRKAESAGAHFIDTRVRKGQGRDDLANEFEATLREWMTMNFCHSEPLSVIASACPPLEGSEKSCPRPSGKIIALLGMGSDGHTAGIFPDADENVFHDRFESDCLVAGYRAPEYATCPERVTATLSFLEKNVDQAFVFVSGEEKRAVWERVLRNDEPIHLLPAGIFHRLRSAEVFTDIGFSNKG